MEAPPETDSTLMDTAKRVMWRMMAICHNRSELLMVEIEEERERARIMLFLATGAAFLGSLGAITLTAVIAIAAAPHYLIALVVLAILYISGAALLYFNLKHMLRHWETLPSTREQLEKDRECLEKRLI